MFLQSSAAPKRSVDTPRAGIVQSREDSFYNKGFRRELVATWKERAPGRPPGAKDGCVPLSKSLPTLVLSFLLCEIGYNARWASQSLWELDSKDCSNSPLPRPCAGSDEAGPAAATPLSAAARHSRPGTDVANLQGASPAGFSAHAASRPSSVTSAASPGQRGPPEGRSGRVRPQPAGARSRPRPDAWRPRARRG